MSAPPRDLASRPLPLTELEQRLPFPGDILLREVDDDSLPSGLGWFAPEHRLVFVVSRGEARDRAFTLAHECAHVLLGHHAALAEERDIEAEADMLGAILLMAAELEGQIRVGRGMPPIDRAPRGGGRGEVRHGDGS